MSILDFATTTTTTSYENEDGYNGCLFKAMGMINKGSSLQHTLNTVLVLPAAQYGSFSTQALKEAIEDYYFN